ncbi:MAG: S9 family peptidase, partial [Myxococcaceae bacterium]
MKLKTAVTTAALLLPLVSGAAGKAPAKPAATEKQPVESTYHGTTVADPYQWMESASDPRVQQWTDTQNAYTRATLDKLPGREGLRQRITELLSWKSPAYGALEEKGGVIVAMKFQPPKQQPSLVVLGSLDDTSKERVLLDATQVDPSGKTTIDWFQLTHDGKKVAVSLSKSGTESGDVSVYDVATAKALANEVVPRVNGGTAGGSLAWNAQGTGFFYTRYPRGEERPPIDREVYQQVYFHALGTPTEKDTYALGKDFPRIAMTDLEASDDGQYT